MFGHVMAAWDGSPSAAHALEVAIDLTERYGAKLTIVSVSHAPEHAETRHEQDEARQRAAAFYRQTLAERFAHRRTDAVGQLPIVHDVIQGAHPADDLVHYAREHGVDVIVMGRRGMGRVERYMIGSVSDRVVRYASCAVLVVGTPATR